MVAMTTVIQSLLSVLIATSTIVSFLFHFYFGTIGMTVFGGVVGLIIGFLLFIVSKLLWGSIFYIICYFLDKKNKSEEDF